MERPTCGPMSFIARIELTQGRSTPGRRPKVFMGPTVVPRWTQLPRSSAGAYPVRRSRRRRMANWSPSMSLWRSASKVSVSPSMVTNT